MDQKLYIFYNAGIRYIHYHIIIENNKNEMLNKLLLINDIIHPCIGEKYVSENEIVSEYYLMGIDTGNMFSKYEVNEIVDDDLIEIGNGLDNISERCWLYRML